MSQVKMMQMQRAFWKMQGYCISMVIENETTQVPLFFSKRTSHRVFLLKNNKKQLQNIK